MKVKWVVRINDFTFGSAMSCKSFWAVDVCANSTEFEAKCHKSVDRFELQVFSLFLKWSFGEDDENQTLRVCLCVVECKLFGNVNLIPSNWCNSDFIVNYVLAFILWNVDKNTQFTRWKFVEFALNQKRQRFVESSILFSTEFTVYFKGKTREKRLKCPHTKGKHETALHIRFKNKLVPTIA